MQGKSNEKLKENQRKIKGKSNEKSKEKSRKIKRKIKGKSKETFWDFLNFWGTFRTLNSYRTLKCFWASGYPSGRLANRTLKNKMGVLDVRGVAARPIHPANYPA